VKLNDLPKEPGDFRERIERETIRGYHLIHFKPVIDDMEYSIRALKCTCTDIGGPSQYQE